MDLEVDSVLNNNMTSFFKYASFNFTKENGDNVLCRLHIGDVISIKLEEGENFAIIKAIFCHQQDNNLRFAFIVVDWFEDMDQRKLGCPILDYEKQVIGEKFSINLVNAINDVHFVHCCKDEECGSNHDSRNRLYMRNVYFFKAV